MWSVLKKQIFENVEYLPAMSKTDCDSFIQSVFT